MLWTSACTQARRGGASLPRAAGSLYGVRHGAALRTIPPRRPRSRRSPGPRSTRLPEPFASHLGEVVLQVEELAEAELLADLGIDDPLDLTGLYEGLPIGEKSVDIRRASCPTGSACSAARSSTNGSRKARSLEHLVRHILIHEVGHHFGLSRRGHARARGAGLSALLEGRGLALVRGGRLLFEGLDLELGPGEALHLTGPNGSGKSSLIRLAAGLLRPAAGTIERGRVRAGRRASRARPRTAAGQGAGLLARADA